MTGKDFNDIPFCPALGFMVYLFCQEKKTLEKTFISILFKLFTQFHTRTRKHLLPFLIFLHAFRTNIIL